MNDEKRRELGNELLDLIMKLLPRPEEEYLDEIDHGYRHNYDDILCEKEDEAEIIADFLEQLTGFDFHTGYYDPEEDKRNGEVDASTGYYYVDFD